MESLEEVLGSVCPLETAATPASSSVPLRSSARVSKKKLDSLNKVLSPAPVEKRENEKEEIPEEIEKAPAKKPVMWPIEEKLLFFEAVNEYGKDFAAIQRYFVLKNKNKNGPVRTKDQIRRYYYRTWAKIAPKLHFPAHIPKKTQELYGLINYGELNKKCKGRTKKDALRLNELIIRGFTQIRGKNKTIIIRTPRCSVLRRLCRVEENQEVETKLPSSIRVELMPADNHTWAQVQALAQNPRVNVHVPMQCRLSSLINFLHKRWLHRNDKYKLKIMEQYDADVPLTDTKHSVVLTAKPNAEAHVAHINLNHYNSHTKICLSSYEEMLGKKGESLAILNKLYAELGAKFKKQKSEVVDREKRTEGESKDDGATEPQDGDIKREEAGCIQQVDNLLLSDAVKEEFSTEEDDVKEQNESVPTTVPVPVTDSDEVVSKMNEGWTLENCQALTVGDVYLMFGSEFKLQLDYRLKTEEAEPRPMVPLSSLLSRLVRMAGLLRSKPTQCVSCRHQCPDSKRPRKDSSHEESTLTGQLNPSDAPFRRPAVQSGNRRIAAAASRIDAESFRAQMDKLTPKYCNRRGRGISNKTVVVQRTLPILPKIANSAPVLKVLPQMLPTQCVLLTNGIVVNHEEAAVTPIGEESLSMDLPPSPTPSISTLLCEPFKPFSGGGCERDGEEETTAGGAKQEWLSEVTECSLSSLLNHLETPQTIKCSSTDSIGPTPPDVESHFQYLMTEASLDFTAKFAALAAEVTSNDNQ